jgi:murein DD-endopeptidase MepM/ murein hydrolase activator NlpD
MILATGVRPPLQARAVATVQWHPEQAREGSLAEVYVHADAGTAPDSAAGVVAGEALHFERSADGSFWAVVPVPLGCPDTLTVTIVLSDNGASSDTVLARLPVRRRSEAMQLLELPPPFNRPPDSATTVRLEAEAALLDSIRERGRELPRLWRGPFMRPVAGRVTTAFGEGRRIDGMPEPRHLAVDLAGAEGSAIRAANRGVVVLVRSLYASGLTVVLAHGAGLVTSYGHLRRATVAIGDTLTRGEVLGRVGATGRATGPHLHWAAFYGALAVDPLSLLTLKGPLR